MSLSRKRSITMNSMGRVLPRARAMPGAHADLRGAENAAVRSIAMADDELRRVPEVAGDIPVRIHRGHDRGPGLLLPLRREEGSRHAGQDVPRRGEARE